MKKYQMIVFFTIALTIYSLVNIYIFSKVYHSVPVFQNNKLIYTLSCFVLAGLFIFAKVLESKHSSVVTDALNIILLILRIPGIVKGDNILIFKKWSFLVILSVSAVLIIGGFINAIIPVTR